MKFISPAVETLIVIICLHSNSGCHKFTCFQTTDTLNAEIVFNLLHTCKINNNKYRDEIYSAH